jgi:hypothetical protein
MDTLNSRYKINTVMNNNTEMQYGYNEEIDEYVINIYDLGAINDNLVYRRYEDFRSYYSDLVYFRQHYNL